MLIQIFYEAVSIAGRNIPSDQVQIVTMPPDEDYPEMEVDEDRRVLTYYVDEDSTEAWDLLLAETAVQPPNRIIITQ